MRLVSTLKVIKTGNVDNVDFDIEDVLAAGKQKTAELTAKLKEMAGSSMAANFTMDGGAGSMYKMENKDDDEDGDGINTGFFLDIGQRDRKSRGGYNIDQMYRDQMGAKKEQKPQAGPKMPKHLMTPQFLDFQFYNGVRLDELFAKRRDWWHRYQVALKESGVSEKKSKKEEGEGGEEESPEVVLDGKEVDENEGWTNEEMEEAEMLQKEGFSSWTKKDFSVFKSACERHGRKVRLQCLPLSCCRHRHHVFVSISISVSYVDACIFSLGMCWDVL